MITLVLSTALAQTLEVPTLVLGQAATLRVTGVAPGTQVAFVAGSAGGAGPCLGPQPDDCLSVVAPRLLGARSADAAGVAMLVVVVPATTPIGPVVTQAMVVTGLAGAREFAATAVAPTTVEPLSFLSDTFDGQGWDPDWSFLNTDLALLSPGNGSLAIVPLVTGPGLFWYQDGEGVLVYQDIRGDFEVTTRALATRGDGSGDAPLPSYRLGGITIRNASDTAPGTHDFLHLAVGAGDALHPYAVEHKLTVDSSSTFAFVSVPFEWLDLRIVRAGDTFELSYKRVADVAWTPVVTHVVPQLPASVQVGLMAYSAQLPTDLQVNFESFDLR